MKHFRNITNLHYWKVPKDHYGTYIFNTFGKFQININETYLFNSFVKFKIKLLEHGIGRSWDILGITIELPMECYKIPRE